VDLHPEVFTRAAGAGSSRASIRFGSPPLNGILTHHEIGRLLADGAILPQEPLTAVQSQPTTLDLRLGPEALQIRAGFLPQRHPRARVAELAAPLVEARLDLRGGALLRRGQVYLVRLLEDLALPPGLRGRANPRSSTGRIDVFTRTVVDGHDRFDEIPAGYRGPLWLQIVPRSFDVRVATGLRFNQVRFVHGSALLSDSELERRCREQRLIDESAPGVVEAASLLLGLSLRPDLPGRPVAFRARPDAPPLDLVPFADGTRHSGDLDPRAWFEPLGAAPDGSLLLQPEEFYILASAQRLRVPPDLAAEMLPWDVGMGELRTNYAGFFHPGFGWTDSGARAVLEVRPHDVPFRVEHGQAIFRLQFSRTVADVTRPYGSGDAAYQNQGLALARYFRPAAP